MWLFFLYPGINQRVPAGTECWGLHHLIYQRGTKLTKLANDLNILDLERQVSATDTTFCYICIWKCFPYPIMVALSCDKVQCLQSIFFHPEGIYKMEIDTFTNNSSQYKKGRLNKELSTSKHWCNWVSQLAECLLSLYFMFDVRNKQPHWPLFMCLSRQKAIKTYVKDLCQVLLLQTQNFPNTRSTIMIWVSLALLRGTCFNIPTAKVFLWNTYLWR